MAIKLTRKQAIQQLWEIGNLEYLLKGKQKDIKKYLKENNKTISVVLASRRIGKSHILCAWAIEECIKKPNSVVKYACPTKSMVYTIIYPIIKKIIDDAPEHLKPEWKEKRQVWSFPNGSEIQIAGTDKGNIEFLRGGAAVLCICDEAGFMDDLDYAVNSVLAPTTDTTQGKVVLASTPNYKDPNHEFHINFLYPLEETNELVRYTVYDSPMVTPEKIKEIINRYPKKELDPKFQCEYLCNIKVDLDEMVIGEFNEESQVDLVKEWERPDYCDFYTAADPGFKDLTAVLFAYYDYNNATLVIEDELVVNGAGMTTETLAMDILYKEKKVFHTKKLNFTVEPFMRVIDNNNLILVNDLHRLHGILFIPTKKDNKEASINEMKIMFREKKIIINPRCVHLIYQLKNVRWNKSRSDFARIKDSQDGLLKGGHADCVAALMYLVRNVIFTKDPFPEGYGILTGHDVHNSGYSTNHVNKEHKSILDIIFNRKK